MKKQTSLFTKCFFLQYLNNVGLIFNKFRRQKLPLQETLHMISFSCVCYIADTSLQWSHFFDRYSKTSFLIFPYIADTSLQRTPARYQKKTFFVEVSLFMNVYYVCVLQEFIFFKKNVNNRFGNYLNSLINRSCRGRSHISFC